MKTNIRGFTLMEILIVAVIAVIVLSWAVEGMTERVLSENIKAEDAALESLKADIVRSFDSDDFATMNLAAFTADIPSGVPATRFSTSTNPTYTATDSSDWFAKLAKVRGYQTTTAAPTQANQPALYHLLYNKFGRARLLIAAPAELEQQRFLLISLFATPEKMTLPAYQSSKTWFDSIWNHEWNTRTGSVPSYWASFMSTAERNAWNGGANGSNLFRLRVVRITLPRYKLNISNGHSTHAVWLYWNGAVNGSPSAFVNPNAGAWTSGGILGGRLVRARIGTSEATAGSDERRIRLRQDTDIIVE